jgi:hypothetical protein
MPAQSDKQAAAAKLAGALKSGKFPRSKAGPAVRAMAKMGMDKLKHFMHKEEKDLRFHCKKCKTSNPYKCGCHQDVQTKMDKLITRKYLDSLKKSKGKMSEAQKKKLIIGLKKLKEGYAGGGNTDITNPDNVVAEMDTDTERHVVAKTFDTKGDFDSYVNQHRGIQFTPKEQQAIMSLQSVKPNQQDNFFVKYEKTDDFGTNQTVVIKKLKDGNTFCWTAFANYAKADAEADPEGEEQGGNATVNDDIRITKTITFENDDESANILGDFLRGLEL